MNFDDWSGSKGVMYLKSKEIRHNRILDIRSKIAKGWTMESLMNFCTERLGVTKQTATSYIDEAAEPFRKKFQENLNESN